MSYHSSLLARSIRGLAIVVLGLSAFSSLRAQNSAAPTASEDPGVIDQAWQKASSKYDSARAALLKDVDSANAQGPFRADWEALQKFEAPDWYRDAKFGIFIHWGVYSVPAFGSEWYPRLMYQPGSPEFKHHIATYGPQDKFGYKDFVPKFKAERYDPVAWAELFKKAGAKYVVPVAEHHDGFAMYDSGVSDWTAAKMGPHRDLIVVEKYHPDIVYFDWWIGQASIRANLTRFAAFYYNSSLKYGDHVGVINYKDYAMNEHAGVLDLERGQLGDIRPLQWQTDTSISNKSWGYIQDDTFKSPKFVVQQLIDIVSKNGNLLLNIGPRSDGTIPDEVQRVLLDVGEWLNTNGEAIYGTRPWRTYGEGPTKVAAGSFHDTDTANYTPEDFRFTTKGDVLYAIGLAWPGAGEALIHSLALTLGGKRVQSVSLVGSETKVQFSQGPEGLRVVLPNLAPLPTLASPAKYAYALRVRFDQ